MTTSGLQHSVKDIILVANAIRQNRYPDAAAVFAAGSIIRGEGTALGGHPKPATDGHLKTGHQI